MKIFDAQYKELTNKELNIDDCEEVWIQSKDGVCHTDNFILHTADGLFTFINNACMFRWLTTNGIPDDCLSIEFSNRTDMFNQNIPICPKFININGIKYLMTHVNPNRFYIENKPKGGIINGFEIGPTGYMDCTFKITCKPERINVLLPNYLPAVWETDSVIRPGKVTLDLKEFISFQKAEIYNIDNSLVYTYYLFSKEALKEIYC